MKRIMFVCTGNTCRSPMAAVIFNAMAKNNRLENVQAFSRGLSVNSECGMNPLAEQVLQECGCTVNGHRAMEVMREDVESATRIYCMTQKHREALVKMFPEYADKIRTIAPWDIMDPYGGTLEDYRKCRSDLVDVIYELVQEMKA